MQSQEINELAKALAAAQAQIKSAKKDADNPFFKSKYADLASVMEACREPLAKNGLAVTQTTDFDEKGAFLVTTLMHTSGQWISGRYPLQAKDGSPQAMGSAVTYARRYSLQAIVGVAADDDDGEAAEGRGTEAKKKTKPAMTQSPATSAHGNGEHDQRIPYCEDCGEAMVMNKAKDGVYCPNWNDGNRHSKPVKYSRLNEFLDLQDLRMKNKERQMGLNAEVS